MATKRQIITRNKNKYLKASKKEKSKLLTALGDTTGLIRGHLIRILSSRYEYTDKLISPRRGRKPVYGIAHKRLLVAVWELLNYPSSRRLAAAMAAVLDNLERTGNKDFDPVFKKEMLRLSPGTMDRLLEHDRKTMKPVGLAIHRRYGSYKSFEFPQNAENPRKRNGRNN